MFAFLWGTNRPSVSVSPLHLLLHISTCNDTFNDACLLENSVRWLLNRHKMTNCIYFPPTQTQKYLFVSNFMSPTSHAWIINPSLGKQTFGLGGLAGEVIEIWRCVCVCVPTSNQCACYWLFFWVENEKSLRGVREREEKKNQNSPHPHFPATLHPRSDHGDVLLNERA